MYKKISLILFILFTAFSNKGFTSQQNTSHPYFKPGFRIGVQTGYKREAITHQGDFIVVEDLAGVFTGNETTKKRNSLNTSLFGAHAGYDYFIGRFYTALELHYRYSPKSNQVSEEVIHIPGGDPVKGKFEQQHAHNIGLSWHLGAIVFPNFLLYGTFNAHLGCFKYKFKEEPELRNLNAVQHSECNGGVGLGVGGRYALPNFYSISLEATYDIYQRANIAQNVSALQDAGLRTNFRTFWSNPRVCNVILKLSKNF